MILIITNRTDVTSDFVVKEIHRRGLNFMRLNTDEYPSNINGSVVLDNKKFNRYLYFQDRKKNVDLSEIKSILYRRPIPPLPHESIIDESIRKFCIDECYDFIRGLWLSLDAFWISDPESIRKAEHKIYQLKFAQKCNFKIPKTLITNNPEDLKQFIDNTKNDVIVKPLYSGFIDKSDINDALMIYTTKIDKDDTEEFEKVSYAPSIFQECIEKEFDIRVTIIGNTVFAAKIYSSNLPENTPDWRFAEIENLEHQVYHLPKEIENSCKQLIKYLNLEFGAIDLVVDNNNNYYFLEINANGQWAWLEKILNFPISSSIVDHLMKI